MSTRRSTSRCTCRAAGHCAASELTAHPRTGRTRRKPVRRADLRRARLIGMVPISQRTPEVADRPCRTGSRARNNNASPTNQPNPDPRSGPSRRCGGDVVSPSTRIDTRSDRRIGHVGTQRRLEISGEGMWWLHPRTTRDRSTARLFTWSAPRNSQAGPPPIRSARSRDGRGVLDLLVGLIDADVAELAKPAVGTGCERGYCGRAGRVARARPRPTPHRFGPIGDDTPTQQPARRRAGQIV